MRQMPLILTALCAASAARWNYRPDLTPDDVPCDLESAGRYLNE